MYKNDSYRKLKIITVLLIAFCFTVVILCKESVFRIGESFPECWIHKKTGFLCPACGNTRSVISMLKGNIIEAMGYNIFPVLLCVTGLVFYIELVARCFNRNIIIFPRSNKLVIILAIIVCGYFILRNIFPILTIC